MHSKVVSVGRAALLLLAASCSSQGTSTRDAVKNKIEAGALVVDVRTPEEFRAAAYPSAVNIPLAEIPNRLREFGEPTRPVVLYCRSGNRSGQAKRLLEERGFVNVTNAGGLKDMPPP
jgi:phage shock protein E